MTWSIENKTCLITGASKGIGVESAVELVKRGVKRMILACRNVDNGNKAAERIKKEVGDTGCDIQVFHLDLSSFKSVRKCAEKVLAEVDELHVLVCNAVIYPPGNERIVTEDGNELTFQVNHLGHFLLVHLLRPLLAKSKPSRIVVVTSDAYELRWFTGTDVEDMNLEKEDSFEALKAYGQSKLANIHFARQLNIVLNNGKREAISGIAVFYLFPGFVVGKVNKDHQPWLFLFGYDLVQKVFGTSIKRGTTTTLLCCCKPDIENTCSGEFFGRGRYVPGWKMFPNSRDDKMAERLWEISMELTGLQPSKSDSS